MLNLTKEDTYYLKFKEKQLESFKKRYRFKTLHKWWCLNCGTEIQISYDSMSYVNIFCNDIDCKISYNKQPTLVMKQYLKSLKESQLKLIETINFNT